MTLRTGHGRGKGQPRIEVLPPNELPAPQAAQADPVARRSDGRIADSTSAKVLGSRGGQARAARGRLMSALGLVELAADAAFAPYRSAGDDFVRLHLEQLATQSGGSVGPGPSSIVATAGMQLAASRYLSDLAAASGSAKDFAAASQLGNDSRQNLLAAYELAVREAKARREATKGRRGWAAAIPATGGEQ